MFGVAEPMKPAVYNEASVVSYLTARPSSDIVAAAYRKVTRERWHTASRSFPLVMSELVVRETGAGEPDAARARLEALESVTTLDTTEVFEKLALHLLDPGAVPRRAATDTAHIAIVAAHENII